LAERPTRLDPAIQLKPLESRVKGAFFDAQQIARQLLNELRDGISVKMAAHQYLRTSMSSVPGKRSAFGFSVPIDCLLIRRRSFGPVRRNRKFLLIRQATAWRVPALLASLSRRTGDRRRPRRCHQSMPPRVGLSAVIRRSVVYNLKTWNHYATQHCS